MNFHRAVLRRGAAVSRVVFPLAVALSVSALALAQQPPPTQEQAQQQSQKRGPAAGESEPTSSNNLNNRGNSPTGLRKLQSNRKRT